jgi:hypothetical protein
LGALVFFGVGKMMKNIFILFLVMQSAFSGCAQGNGTNVQPRENDVKIKIIVGGNEFSAVTYDNETTRAFISRLPLTVNMTELNRNEKYYNLPQNLPGTPQSPGTIYEGDIMIWSSNTLVLFYRTFSTRYSYIRIGRIENTSGLETALGTGNIEVTFMVQQD